MKELKTKFKRNGLIYTLIDRTPKVALFILTIMNRKKEECVGYEVCKIYTKSSKIVNGNTIEEHETIPSNDQFAIIDNSKSFFANETGKIEAYEYYKEYVNYVTI
jgi:hypothetical protein